MKKDDIKTFGIVLLVCVICVVIVLILTIKSNSDKLNDVDNSNMYFMVINYVNYYVNNIVGNNADVIYDILDTKFIEKEGVKLDNLYDKTGKFPENSVVKVKKMQYFKKRDNYIFYVEGIVYQNNMDERIEIDDSFALIVIVSNEKSAFSIFPTNKKCYRKDINGIKKINIINNDNNKLIPIDLINKEKMCIIYLSDYIDKIYYNIDDAYSFLSSDMKKNFESLDSYKNYIYNNINKITSVGVKCSMKKFDDKKVYTVIDNNDNTYVFTEESVMNYKVDFYMKEVSES